MDDFAVSARNKIVSSELYNGVMIKIDHEMMQRTANENAARKRRTVCVCSRQRHDVLDFSNCPLSRVLHVTLASWQEFGFEVITILVSIWMSVDKLNIS